MNAIAEPDLRTDHTAAARRSLRVAVVTETYPPEVNGVSLTVARYVEGLRRRNHEVQLVRPRQAEAHDGAGNGTGADVLVRGLSIPRYPHLRIGFPSRKRLIELWSMSRPDVVHIATEGPLGYSALQAAEHLRLPATSDFRTNFHAYSTHYGAGWLRRPILAYLRKFHNRTGMTMVPTEPLQAEMRSAGFLNLEVVRRGVDTSLFDPARRSAALRRSWGVDDDATVVACVGRLAPEKNLHVLVQAFDAIRRLDRRARLLLVGDGPLRTDLARHTTGAILAGQRRGEDLAAHYASADLFLFPSMTETFGNVTAEAMASGLPVVAFDYAAAAQLISSGASGVLVPFGNSREFVHAATQLARSAAHRSLLGRNARQCACAHGWDDVIARFERLLEQAMCARVATAL